MLYLTTVTCPVCGEVFDELWHPKEKLHGQVVAFKVQPKRLKHRDASPECEKDERWIRVWDTKTVPVERPTGRNC